MQLCKTKDKFEDQTIDTAAKNMELAEEIQYLKYELDEEKQKLDDALSKAKKLK